MGKTGKLCPADKIQELQQILKGPEITTHLNDEEGYEYLEKGHVCMEVQNPGAGDNLFLDVEDQFTLSFGEWDSQYAATEADFKLLCEDLNLLLNKKMYTVVVYVKDDWICSLTVREKEIRKNNLLDHIRDFLHSADCDAFIDLMQKEGASIRCTFWGEKTKKVHLTGR